MIPAQLSLKLSLRRHAPHRLLDPRLGDVAVALGPEGFAGEVDLEGYRRDQPWINSSFAPDGSIRPAYVQRRTDHSGNRPARPGRYRPRLITGIAGAS